MSAVTLTFIIPTYKRPHLCLRAVTSVLDQIILYNLTNISLIVGDDSSPSFCIQKFQHSLLSQSSLYPDIQVLQNTVNKGMSKNIAQLVERCTTDFYTILTDDDILEDGALPEIVDSLSYIHANNIKSLFVPRYGYTEKGELHSIECRPSSDSKLLIPSNPLTPLLYSRNAFILTGHFFHTSLTRRLWHENINNSFFPVLNYADALFQASSLFLNKKWFKHTVDNECHWSSWGDTELSQHIRLHSDFLQARKIILCSSLKQAQLLSLRLRLLFTYTNIIISDLREIVRHFHAHTICALNLPSYDKLLYTLLCFPFFTLRSLKRQSKKFLSLLTT